MGAERHVCVKSEEIAKLRTTVIIANTHTAELKKEMASIKSLLNKILVLVIGALITGIVTLLIK